MYQIGIDIGGTSIKAGLFQDRELLQKLEVQTDKSEGWESIFLQLQKVIDALIIYTSGQTEDAAVTIGEISGIGIGIPGLVELNGIIRTAVNLAEGSFDLRKRMRAAYPQTSIAIENDANAAALGEACHSGAQNAILLTFGTGIGGGIIADGKIWRGADGGAGEFGHILVNPKETERCACGRCGCLEQYASASGIKRLSKIRLHRECSAREVFDLAKEGDVPAVQLVDEITDLTGWTLANIACSLEPEVILIGGGMAKAGEFWRERLEKAYRKYAMDAYSDIPIRLAVLGNDAGIYGGMEMS